MAGVRKVRRNWLLGGRLDGIDGLGKWCELASSNLLRFEA